MARLAASHRRCRADRRDLYAARVGKAAHPEPDRHAVSLSPVRFDAGQRPAARGHRGLPGLDAGKLRTPTFILPLWLRPRDVRGPVNNGNSGDCWRAVLARRAYSRLNEAILRRW